MGPYVSAERIRAVVGAGGVAWVQWAALPQLTGARYVRYRADETLCLNRVILQDFELFTPRCFVV